MDKGGAQANTDIIGSQIHMAFRFMIEESARWAKTIKMAGIKIE